MTVTGARATFLLLPTVVCALLGAACVGRAGGGVAPAPGTGPRAPGAGPPARAPDQASAILRVRGADIVDGTGRAVILRGVAFGNQVWSNERIPKMHHGEQDFARVASLGMNVVRFYLNYRTLESDDEPGKYLDDGFRWLDENVAWARENGVYLVFNLHVPPGGYQSLGDGTGLWTDLELQRRFVAWWRALAAHFRGEPTVAGYDLLNEPGVTKSIDQWRDLASRTAKAIREVDPEHMIFVERVNSVGKDWKENAARNFFRIEDPNVVYEFHFYKPFHFTHQGAPWIDFAAEDSRYPDPSVAEVEWFLLEARAHAESQKLPTGASPWTYYPGQIFTVSDPAIVVGKPVLTVDKLGTGQAFFDDLVLEQVDAQGRPIKTLWKRHLTTRRGWFFWRADDSGSLIVSASGHDHDGALEVTGTRSWANLGADPLRFRAEQGASYRLSGWMRGENMPAEAVARLEIEFSSSKVPVQVRDKALLKQELSAYLDWGKQQNVPLFLGEWGAIRASFADDRGGLRWTSDMLDLLLENRVHFAWHAYHESSFGFFDGDGALPRMEDANVPLMDLFRARLKGARD
jgi:endoglucanase